MSENQEQREIRPIAAKDAPRQVEGASRGRPAIYPFEDLEVGGAFKVPEDKIQAVRQAVSNRNNAEKSDKQYKMAKAENGAYYVWRMK